MWIIPTYSNKMAESQDVPRSGNIFVGGLARALLSAMEYFENERHRGRACRGPIIVHANGVGRIVGWGRGLPHGRIPIPSTKMPELGCLSSRRGRGRGLSLLIPTPASTLPRPLGRGFPPSSSPDSPPPLEDCSPPRRHREAPLRQPCTMPCCLKPHGHFPAPPPYAFHDPNAPTL